jgi:hypothetical protein
VPSLWCRDLIAYRMCCTGPRRSQLSLSIAASAGFSTRNVCFSATSYDSFMAAMSAARCTRIGNHTGHDDVTREIAYPALFRVPSAPDEKIGQSHTGHGHECKGRLGRITYGMDRRAGLAYIHSIQVLARAIRHNGVSRSRAATANMHCR